jgi:hypothetical protein
MFDFYHFDAFNSMVILCTALVLYIITTSLDRFKEYNKALIVTVSILVGVFTSVFISYMNVEKDILLTSDYWD